MSSKCQRPLLCDSFSSTFFKYTEYSCNTSLDPGDTVKNIYTSIISIKSLVYRATSPHSSPEEECYQVSWLCLLFSWGIQTMKTGLFFFFAELSNLWQESISSELTQTCGNTLRCVGLWCQSHKRKFSAHLPTAHRSQITSLSCSLLICSCCITQIF